MLSIVDRATSVLERRFLKNAFLPVLLFFPALLAPFLIWSGTLQDRVAAWEVQSIGVKALEMATYLAGTWFLAAIVASQWRNIIRLFEGYPLAAVAPLDRLGRDWHDRRRVLVRAGQLRGTPYYEYPHLSDRVLPTRLGNRLLAAERGAFELYGADGIFLWPRMIHVIPREVVQDVEDTRATLEFLLVVALWLALFGVGNLGILTFAGAPAALLTACFLGGIVGAWSVYRSALPAAMEYGEQLRTAIEVYRHDLLARLKLGMPEDVDAEKELWLSHREYVFSGRDPKKLTPPAHALSYVETPTAEAAMRVDGAVRVILEDSSTSVGHGGGE